MRAAAMSHIGVIDVVAHDDEILCKQRFSPLLKRAAVTRLLTIWHAKQAISVYHMADFAAVFAMPLHAPPLQIDTSAHRNTCIKSRARVVGEGKWGGEKKPKPGEKKPEQKPDKKKPRRDGGREPREPRQPNRNFIPLISSSAL